MTAESNSLNLNAKLLKSTVIQFIKNREIQMRRALLVCGLLEVALAVEVKTQAQTNS